MLPVRIGTIDRKTILSIVVDLVAGCGGGENRDASFRIPNVPPITRNVGNSATDSNDNTTHVETFVIKFEGVVRGHELCYALWDARLVRIQQSLLRLFFNEVSSVWPHFPKRSETTPKFFLIANPRFDNA